MRSQGSVNCMRACGHGDAGLELSALAGAETSPSPSGSPTRPFFPLGRIAGGARRQPCTAWWRGGCATKRCSGGSPRSGSWNCAHVGSNKVVLGERTLGEDFLKMPSQLAVIICIFFILYLFRMDLKKSNGPSIALW